MATDIIPPTQRAECIRLQAERTVAAYRELIAKSKGGLDDVALAAMGELFVQVRSLEGWLQPVAADAEAERAEEPDTEEPATLKAKLGEAWHTLHGIEQVARMLWDHPDADEETHGAAFTIRQAAQRGYEAIDEAQALLRNGGAA